MSFRRRPPPSLLLLALLPGVRGGTSGATAEGCEVGGVGGGATGGIIIRRSDASPNKSLSEHSLSSAVAEHWGAARPPSMMLLPSPPPSLDSISSSVALLLLLPILAGMLILRSEIDDPTPLKDLPACLTMDDDLLLTKDETALPFFV